jgi:hypothetical protein
MKVEINEGKDGKLYYNADLREMEYDKPEELVLLFDRPIVGKYKGRQWANFAFGYKDKRIGVFVRDNMRTTNGESLLDALSEFEHGDIITITRRKSKTRRIGRWEIAEDVGKIEDLDLDDYKLPKSKPKKKLKKVGKTTTTLNDQQIAEILDSQGFENDKDSVDYVKVNVKVLTKENVVEFLKSQ